MIWEIITVITFVVIFLPDIVDVVADVKSQMKRLDDILKGRRKR